MFFSTRQFLISLFCLILCIQTISTDTTETSDASTVSYQFTHTAETLSAAASLGNSIATGASLAGLTSSNTNGLGETATKLSQTSSALHTIETSNLQTDQTVVNPSNTDGTTATVAIVSGISMPTGSTTNNPVVAETSTNSYAAITQKYTFTVGTNQTLQSGNNHTAIILQNVTDNIKTLFNESIAKISVTELNIFKLAKTTYNNKYDVSLTVSITANDNSCNQECLKKSLISSDIKKIQLPLEGGTLIDVTPTTQLQLDETTTTTTPRAIGESPPGLAARLGMGLGISFLGVLLIGEIAFFIWKSRSADRKSVV